MTVDPQIMQESIVGSTARIVLAISPDLDCLDGHFPGAPIVPGVVQVKWAIEQAQRCFALPDAVIGMEVLKFQRVISPGTEVALSLDYSAHNGKVRFSFESDQGRHSSGRILLAVAS